MTRKHFCKRIAIYSLLIVYSNILLYSFVNKQNSPKQTVYKGQRRLLHQFIH